VRAEGLAARITVEHRREHPQRECSRHEARTPGQALENHLAHRLVNGTSLRDLRVPLYLLGLVAGGHATVDPLRGPEMLAGFGNLVFGEEVWDGD